MPARSTFARAGMGLGCVACALLCAPVFGQDAVPPPPVQPEPVVEAPVERPRDIASLITDLGSPDFSVREAASTALAEMDGSPEDLARHVKDATALSAEQWMRLEQAMQDRFNSTSRAGLGSGLQGPDGQRDTTVSLVIANFPAARFLQLSDLITNIDGVSLERGETGNRKLRAAILSHDPGESVVMVVVREGKSLEMRVPLGRFEDLNQNVDLARVEPDVLDLAWSLRLQRLGLNRPTLAPITPRLAAAIWPERRLPGRLTSYAGVLAGGRPGVQPDNEHLRRIAGINDTLLDQQRQVLRQGPQRLIAGQRPMNIIAQRAQLQQRIALVQDRIDQNTMQLNNSNRLSVQERTYALQEIARARQQLLVLQEVMRGLDGK